MNTTYVNQNMSYSKRASYKPQWEVEKEERELQMKLQQEEIRKQQEFNEQNFPRLGDVPAKLTFWGGSKSFAELANDCAKVSEVEEIFKPIKKPENPNKNVVNSKKRSNMQLPKFNNIHHYVEPEDDQYNEKVKESKEDEEGWIEVNHKKQRRQKSFEEIVNRPPTPEEGDSVWDTNAPEEHETCWDERP